MMTSSIGSILHVTGPFCGEFSGHRWIPLTKASDMGLWCFLDLYLNQWLNKQLRCRWFEMPSCSLWCHCNECHKCSIISHRLRLTENTGKDLIVQFQRFVSMGWYKKDVTPLLMCWSSVFPALTHWHVLKKYSILKSYRASSVGILEKNCHLRCLTLLSLSIFCAFGPSCDWWCYKGWEINVGML